MKKIIAAAALAITASGAFAQPNGPFGTVLGIDFDQPINKQMADNPFVKINDQGVLLTNPEHPWLDSILIYTGSFDNNGNLYSSPNVYSESVSLFYATSEVITDFETCQLMLDQILEELNLHPALGGCSAGPSGGYVFRFHYYLDADLKRG